MPVPRSLGRWLTAVTLLAPSAGAAQDPGAPCAPCLPGPRPTAECVTAPPPRIVVHMPPPEVVFAGGGCGVCGGCGLFRPKGRLFPRLCDHCCGTAVAPAPTATSVLAPLTTTQTVSSLSFLNAGATNLAVSGLGLGATGLNTGGVAVLAANPVLQQAAAGQQTETAAMFDGLRAVHAAEVRTATIIAARAQQNAELQAMMAALDRAKGSMAAVASASNGGQATTATTQGLTEVAAATKETIAATVTLKQQLDQLDERLQVLETDIKAVSRHLREIDRHLGLAAPSTMPKADAKTPSQR